MQKIFPFSGLPGDVADEEDGDDDHKDDGEVCLPPPGLAGADVGVPAVQYSTVQYSTIQYTLQSGRKFPRYLHKYIYIYLSIYS